MKNDPIFYRIFKEFPSTFFELIGEPVEEANYYRFDSCELKQTAFRIDGLFLPIEAGYPLYFVEVQFRYEANLYSGLFSEIFIYLNQYDPTQDWRGVVIYGSLRYEPKQVLPYEDLLRSQRVRRIYLDELPPECFRSLNLRLIEFIITGEEAAVDKGRQLVEEVDRIKDEDERLDIMELLETFIAYKFNNITQEEIREMFGLDEFKKSRLYQDINETSKLEVVPALVKRGFTVEEIAEIVQLDVERVREAVEKLQEN